ncbi:MAG: hypothetical protein R3A45_09500 [Bdellovibrionota bacterium]
MMTSFNKGRIVRICIAIACILPLSPGTFASPEDFAEEVSLLQQKYQTQLQACQQQIQKVLEPAVSKLEPEIQRSDGHFQVYQFEKDESKALTLMGAVWSH